MSIREALDEFQNDSMKIKNSLDKLRDEVKKEGSSKIHRCMLDDKFEEANKIMKMLEEFVKVELKTNYEQISDHVNEMFLEKENQKEIQEQNEESPKETNEMLSFIEKEILEEIGYTASSRISELKTNATEQNIQTLAQKGYLDYRKVRWGQDEYGMFNLTEKGKLHFRQTHGVEAKKQQEPLQEEKNKEFSMNQLISTLKEADYEIMDKKPDLVEVKIDNKSCYMVLSSREIESQMNEHYRLKNIGMICENKDTMSNALNDVKNWVANNKDKSRFLAVHFATIEDVKTKQTDCFKTVRF